MPESDPKITVRLETNEQGRPLVTHESGKDRYEIIFEVENAPEDTYAATFELDPSDYDSVRKLSPEADGKIRLKTTTHGDYPLIVRLHRAKAPDLVLREGIARGLRRARETMPANPEVADALAYISEH